MESDLLQLFREEFQCFTQEELEEAVRTARREIQGELDQYEVYQTHIITKPKRTVPVSTGFQQIPRDYSDEDEDDLVGDTAETGSCVSEENNTISLSVSEQIPQETKTDKSRLSYSLDQLDQIFADIFKSLNVNRNYVPKDSLETERANKRAKDFSARFGRTLYQTKQNFLSFKNSVLKSQLAGRGDSSPARLEGRLAGLLSSCRVLLASYLTFIPLSAGQIFPPLLSDALEVILDIANLTVSLGFSTNNLASGIRELESLMSEERRRQLPDATKLEILNNLAETTFGPPDETKVRRRSPRKAGSAHGQGQVSIKPRGNKIFQQRTNLARQRRMKDIEERNKAKLFPPPPPPATTDFTMEPHVTPANRRILVDDRKTLRDQLLSSKHQQTPRDMTNILRRLHNLELIASSDSTGVVAELESAGPRTGAQSQSQCNSNDLNFLINRLEIIESDFDLIATKYKDRLRPRRKFSSRCTLEDVKYFSDPLRPLKEADVECEERSGLAKDRIEAIVHKITDEILADDLLLN